MASGSSIRRAIMSSLETAVLWQIAAYVRKSRFAAENPCRNELSEKGGHALISMVNLHQG
jgi:hypothetical protein